MYNYTINCIITKDIYSDVINFLYMNKDHIKINFVFSNEFIYFFN